MSLALTGFLSPAFAFMEFRGDFKKPLNWDESVSGYSLDVVIDPVAGVLRIFTVVFDFLGANDRFDIRTSDSDYSWLTADKQPVTYTMTIDRFPPPDSDGYEAHLFLVGNSLEPGRNADFAETNVVYFRVFDNGSDYGAELFYKVNSERKSIRTERFGGAGKEVSAFYGSPSPIGTWGFTLCGNNATMFGPDGSKQTGQLEADALSGFNNSVHLYVGTTPNRTSNSGNFTFISSVTATAPKPLTVNRMSETTIKISWPAFAIDYFLQESDNLVRPGWLQLLDPVEVEAHQRSVVLPLRGSPRFFRLFRDPLAE